MLVFNRYWKCLKILLRKILEMTNTDIRVKMFINKSILFDYVRQEVGFVNLKIRSDNDKKF